jgi:hypothetical protein
MPIQIEGLPLQAGPSGTGSGGIYALAAQCLLVYSVPGLPAAVPVPPLVTNDFKMMF